MIASRAVLALLLVMMPGTALAAPDEAAFRRSVGLRRAWQDLTRDVAGPAHWTRDSRLFSYRKTVAGGFAFETVDARTLAKRPSFDAVRLAAALGAARKERLDPLHLPFADFAYGEDIGTIAFPLDDGLWQCDVVAYRCAADAPSPQRPRGFGVVRDLSVPAENSPKVSPDGRFTAFVEGDNLVVRKAPKSPSPSGEGLGWGSPASRPLGETSPPPPPPLKGRGEENSAPTAPPETSTTPKPSAGPPTAGTS